MDKGVPPWSFLFSQWNWGQGQQLRDEGECESFEKRRNMKENTLKSENNRDV